MFSIWVVIKYKDSCKLVGDRTAKSLLLSDVIASQFADDAVLYATARALGSLKKFVITNQ